MPACASHMPICSPAGQPGLSIDPRKEEAHWRCCHEREPHGRSDRDFEDYAPAYCVGYVGCVQYGGSYEDAQTSLHANWVRIKGDSRLSLEEAWQAIRAAWDRVAAQAAERLAWHVDAAPAGAQPRSPESSSARGASVLPLPRPAVRAQELAST
jgi:hypothetical protein